MIRRATEADIEALKPLRRGFFDSQIAAGLLDIPADLPAMIDTSTAHLVKGRRNDVFVAHDADLYGYLYATTRVVPGYAKPSISVIEEVFIDPGHRGTEAAAALLDMSIDALRTRSPDRIQLRVLVGNDVGRAFWSKKGFVENVRILELDGRT